MELLLIILIIIVAFLTYLLLKKERVLGINIEDKQEQVQTKVIENKNYRKNIYNLLNYFPENNLINYKYFFYNFCFQ